MKRVSDQHKNISSVASEMINLSFVDIEIGDKCIGHFKGLVFSVIDPLHAKIQDTIGKRNEGKSNRYYDNTCL